MLDMNTGLTAGSTGDTTGSINTTITLSAPAKPNRWSIGGLAWSYDGAALSTAAGLNINCPATDTAAANDTSGSLVFSLDINDDGAGFITPAEPIKFPPGRAVVFTLKFAGGDVERKISVLGAKRV